MVGSNKADVDTQNWAPSYLKNGKYMYNITNQYIYIYIYIERERD